MHFIGLGHSHIVALANGAYASQDGGAQFDGQPLTCKFHYLYGTEFDPPVDIEGGLNPQIEAAVSEGAPRFLLTAIGGNEHNVLSIVQIYQRYDFILGENQSLDLDESLQIIPEAVIRETLREWMAEKTIVLRALRRASDLPIVQIEPPPPLPRVQVLTYPHEFFQQAGQIEKMSPDLLRYKMWRVQTGLMRQICADLGVHYSETAPDMLDDQGMLAPWAWGGDATHANDAYGQAMIDRTLALMTAFLQGQDPL